MQPLALDAALVLALVMPVILAYTVRSNRLGVLRLVSLTKIIFGKCTTSPPRPIPIPFPFLPLRPPPGLPLPVLLIPTNLNDTHTVLHLTARLSQDDVRMAPFWERVLRDPGCTHATDCGFPGITADQCHARGCCFDPAPHTQRWCSGVAKNCTTREDCSSQGTCIAGRCECDNGYTGFNCSETLITKVHVVQSCHLDVGFTG